MEIPVQDRSNYLKGLLIVAKKDNQLAETEKKIIKNLALRLGFASDFYDETIRSLLSNKYIDCSPIKFSNSLIAESFITDGFNLAYSDKSVTHNEINWLKETSIINGLSEEWFEKKLSSYTKSNSAALDLALYSII
jgi:ribonucleotide reductase beta subunit family protein with ferritin-like domain